MYINYLRHLGLAWLRDPSALGVAWSPDPSRLILTTMPASNLGLNVCQTQVTWVKHKVAYKGVFVVFLWFYCKYHVVLRIIEYLYVYKLSQTLESCVVAIPKSLGFIMFARPKTPGPYELPSLT
jgi:hypothetical protein